VRQVVRAHGGNVHVVATSGRNAVVGDRTPDQDAFLGRRRLSIFNDLSFEPSMGGSHSLPRADGTVGAAPVLWHRLHVKKGSTMWGRFFGRHRDTLVVNRQPQVSLPRQSGRRFAGGSPLEIDVDAPTVGMAWKSR